MKHMETEYKWEANIPRDFYRAKQTLTNLCGEIPSQKLHIKDTYLDDPQHNLSKQRIALRVRNTDGKWEATFKTRTQIKNGKATRREETLSLTAHTQAQAIAQLQRKKTWKGLDVSRLRKQFEIKNTRTIFQFVFDGANVEMALDKVCVCVCGRQVSFKEIELELKHGSSKSFDRFAKLFSQQTQLKRATFSKVKTAETFLKLWKK